MNAADALRFVSREAALCRDRDEHEALCLLLPALVRVLDLRPMEDVEARAFRERLRLALDAEATPR